MSLTRHGRSRRHFSSWRPGSRPRHPCQRPRRYEDAPGIDLRALGRAADAADVVVIVNPNNPTGTTLPTAEVYALAARYPAKTFLVDESFNGFSAEPRSRTSPTAFPAMRPIFASPCASAKRISTWSTPCVTGCRLRSSRSRTQSRAAAIGGERAEQGARHARAHRFARLVPCARATPHVRATIKASLAPEARTAAPSHPPCTRLTRACDFLNWGQDSVRPSCCTAHLVELLAFASELLTRRGVLPWLDYGSLLGAVRDGRLIPWDADADFDILQADQPTVLALSGEIVAAGHHLDASFPGVIRILYSEVNEAAVDLLLWEARGGLLLPLLDSDYAWPGMASREAFPERFISPLGEATLHGRSFPAPSSAHEFLREHRYGPGYATPARAIKSIHLYPRFDIAETTPEIERLLARIATGDQRLAQLRSESRCSHHRPVEIWQKAALA